MDPYRGPRTRTGPPLGANFRQRNSTVTNHPIHNQHHPPQVQPRFIPPVAMNQQQWSQQGAINAYPAPDEGVGYTQQPYNPEVPGYNNYSYPQGISPPQLMTSSPQPQMYGQQMFMQQPMYHHPIDQVCYTQPTMVTTPPIVQSVENVSPRKFHFNSKENIFICAKCSHKNVLAETEIIKRDEQIEALVKDNEAFRKQNETLVADNIHLRSQIEALQKLLKKEFEGSNEPQKSVNEGVAENAVKSASKSESLSDESKKPSQLSPDAMEFSPKPSMEAGLEATSQVCVEVPVVSAKVMMDEEAPSTVLGSEVATQVEENLFEETNESDASEICAVQNEAGEASVGLPNKDSIGQKMQYEDWNEEVENNTGQQCEDWNENADKATSQPPSHSESKMGEAKNQVQSDDRGPQCSSFMPQEWREKNSQISSPMPGEHWKKNRYNRGSHRYRGPNGAPPGFGKGRATRFHQNDHEGYNDVRPPNHPQRNRFENQNNQNFPHSRHNEENIDHRSNFQRYNRGPRHNDKNDGHQVDFHKRENDSQDDRENLSREKEQFSKEKNFPQRQDDRNRPRDNKDVAQKNASSWNKEDTETKDVRESLPPACQGAWRGKDNNLIFNKNENQETPVAQSSQNQNQKGQAAYCGKEKNVNVVKDDEKKTSAVQSNCNQNQGNWSSNSNHRSPIKVESKAEFPNIVKEELGDLFSAPAEFSLAHCVAEDFRMGSGIAVKFRTEFKRVGELLDQNVKIGGCAHLEDKGRYIFYLVTKHISSGKPKMEDLERSLNAMKAKCLTFGVTKLAMPRIGCGLDKLDWTRVKTKINQVFHDAGIEIRIYEFNVERVPESEGNRPDSRNKLLPVKYRKMKLVNIEQDTALLFLGTENGDMDATALSLNEKHRFEVEYKRADKTIGKVCFFKKNNSYDWVFSLIVAKTLKDKVLFQNVESCCCQLSQILRKNDFRFVGIEFPQGWGNNDQTFFEKILSVLRTTLPKFMELWVCFPSAELDFFNMIKDEDGKDRGNASAK